MPALQPVTGVARCVVRGTSQGQSIVNVFHVRNGGAGAGPYSVLGVTSLASVIATAYGAQFRPLLNSAWSGDEVTVQDLSSPTANAAVTALAGSGSASGPVVPQSVACCITWKINFHYRGGHPRTYLGPIGTAAIENNVSFTSTFVTNVTTAATSFISAINGATADGVPQQFVSVHRTQNGATLQFPLVTAILAGVVDSRLDTMRRRLGPDR